MNDIALSALDRIAKAAGLVPTYRPSDLVGQPDRFRWTCCGAEHPARAQHMPHRDGCAAGIASRALDEIARRSTLGDSPATWLVRSGYLTEEDLDGD